MELGEMETEYKHPLDYLKKILTKDQNEGKEEE